MVDLEVVAEVDNSFVIDCQVVNRLEHCREKLANHTFRILSYNIRSIQANFNNLLVALQRLNISFDVIVLTECYLYNGAIVGQIPGYKSFATKNVLNKNGGVVVYVRDTIAVSVDEPSIEEAECLSVQISDSLVVLAVYRSPSFKKKTNFVESLSTILQSYHNKKSVILTGDININILVPDDPEHTEYLCLLAELGFIAAITEPTRIHNCLDHIFVRSKAHSALGLVADTDITDHRMTMLGICPEITKAKRSSSKITRTDLPAVVEELKKADWSAVFASQDVHEAVSTLKNILGLALQKHTHIKRVSKRHALLKPWMTPGLLRCTQHRDKLHQELRKHPNDKVREVIYKRYRNFCNGLLHNLKQAHDSEALEKHKNSPKLLWKTINSISEVPLRQSSAEELISLKQNPIESLNECNRYFSSNGQLTESNLEPQTPEGNAPPIRPRKYLKKLSKQHLLTLA
ncbi:hypothetical protein NE865_11776 [Phthorimaea operculella]|nr:hypothetical protein NE865_11776 [Phthorimaea operculella]